MYRFNEYRQHKTINYQLSTYVIDNVSGTVEEPRRPSSHLSLVEEVPPGGEAHLLAFRAAAQREPGDLFPPGDEAQLPGAGRLCWE